MKVYIHTDLEGATNVNSMDMIFDGGELTRYAYENLAYDVNAAIEGAFLAGADTVTVLDSHGGPGELDTSILDPRAELDTDDKLWWGKLNEEYDASIFIGAHAMAGTLNGFLDHTMDSRKWFNYSINGRRTGELGAWAAVCGHFGVPLVMVSGDTAACTEAREFFPDVRTVSVKQGLGRNDCEMFDVEKSRNEITKTVQKALGEIKEHRIYRPVFPADIELEFQRSDYCDEFFTKLNNAERINSRTIHKKANSALEILFE